MFSLPFLMFSLPLTASTGAPFSTAGQAYTLRKATDQMSAAGLGSHCLDVYKESGPDVENGGCKKVCVVTRNSNLAHQLTQDAQVC